MVQDIKTYFRPYDSEMFLVSRDQIPIQMYVCMCVRTFISGAP